jgi:hypothetical protein
MVEIGLILIIGKVIKHTLTLTVVAPKPAEEELELCIVNIIFTE